MSDRRDSSNFRRGPAPFPVHIGLAMAEYARMQAEGSAAPEALARMLAGIRKYQAHPYRREISDLHEIWRAGTVSLRLCRAKAQAGRRESTPNAAIILIPSLINKSDILDLLPHKSFARWLAGQGVEVGLLDWGLPCDDPGLQDMDSLVHARLAPAIAAMTAHVGRRVHALGYCMGGTLLAAAASEARSMLRGLVFLASPWDFAAGDATLAVQVRGGTPAALSVVQEKGHLPMDWIQSVFAAVNAGRAMGKFSEFAALDEASEEAMLFVAVEDWLNDGVDMTGGMARTCLVEWYGDNLPGRGLWQVGGRIVDPALLALPSLVVASHNDRLVPRESSLSLARLMKDVTVMAPSTGHIGMMTGRNAVTHVWQPVCDWVRRGDAPA